MIDAKTLVRGQKLLVSLDHVQDRLPRELIQQLKKDPHGKLIGYKMVDGNSFGLVLELSNGSQHWFFENELFETYD